MIKRQICHSIAHRVTKWSQTSRVS
jgi:hypothetical protein